MTSNFNWRIFSGLGQQVEARMFMPETPPRTIVLFCPGFTGIDATLFEQRHVIPLLNEGVACVVLRHAGTRLDTTASDFIVNCDQRMERARKKGETHLGGGPSILSNWLMEPMVALEELDKMNNRIFVIGASFGALSALWSLTNPDAKTGNVVELLCLGGLQGISDDSPDDIMRIWSDDFLESDTVQQAVELDSAQNSINTLREAYKELPYRMEDMPSHIRITYLAVKNDEIVRPSDTERFVQASGGRGIIEIDENDRAHPSHGLSAHDMPDYPSYYLLKHILPTIP